MRADGKLTMSVRHVKVTWSQWREVTEETGQCFLVTVYCVETDHSLAANQQQQYLAGTKAAAARFICQAAQITRG